MKLKEGRLNPVRDLPIRPGILGRHINRGWTIAAAVAALTILAILAGSLRHYLHHANDSYDPHLAPRSTGSVRQQIAGDGSATLMTLPDGSVVRLGPGTHFSINTSPGKRTIISVATGQLSVFHRSDRSDSIVVAPNQPIASDSVGGSWESNDGKIVITVIGGK